ncbi:hypothetical protein [Oryza sativa Japonica Group]|uniref:Uncharacterized protein n=1 Tax=Oryza sativa subsp. japonica TaxID=39947 RepID=Q5QN55_ORYSJ|nr:hypothetical protein [Oryza sativa Japonica Group]
MPPLPLSSSSLIGRSECANGASKAPQPASSPFLAFLVVGQMGRPARSEHDKARPDRYVGQCCARPWAAPTAQARFSKKGHAGLGRRHNRPAHRSPWNKSIFPPSSLGLCLIWV